MEEPRKPESEEREGAAARARKRSWRGRIVLAAIGALALAWYLIVEVGEIPHEPPVVRDDGPDLASTYSEEARALLGGLEVGDEIEGGFFVSDVHGPIEGHIAVGLELEGARLEIRVLRHGTSTALPPLSDSRFDFHVTVPPDAPQLQERAVQAALGGISARIVDEVPIPPEM
jgi:hypothetical protein